MENPKKLNLVYGNKTYNLSINQNDDFDVFVNNIFSTVTKIEVSDNLDIINYVTAKFMGSFFITWITKVVNEKNWEEVKSGFQDDDTIFVSNKLLGGFLVPPPVIIMAIFALLIPLLKPIAIVVRVFIGFFDIIGHFINLMLIVLEIIPVIFDPPRLMDDILFAVTFGINTMFSKAAESATGGANKPKDDNKPEGPFGVTNKKQAKCIDPTFSTILLLIICPPMAIFMKLGFLKGIVSAIICGVLCVKLYYFPGLLFAILHVLC